MTKEGGELQRVLSSRIRLGYLYTGKYKELKGHMRNPK